MVAIISYPGTQSHEWFRGTKSQASKWLEDRTESLRKAGRTDLVITGRLIPEREARKAFYRDRTPCYPVE